MPLREVGSNASLDRGLDEFSSAPYRSQLARAPVVAVPPVQASRANAVLELALSLSGAGLAAFMLTHEALHVTLLFGAPTYDRVAEFMERYYLLTAVVPPLVALFFAHVFLVARRVPTAYSQQSTLLRHMCALRHLDTWTWLMQVLTGIALLVLASIHVWVILTDLPIEASRGGARVFGVYIWLYVPFVVVVQMHAALGLYRIAVKWWLVSRPWARLIASVWLVATMSLGFVVLVAFYRLGGGQ